jgi:WD40 repeat protein
MNLNGGLGAVILKNQALYNDSLIPGRITACKHANGRDWWIFAPRYMNGKLFEFLVTPFGIQGPFQKNIVTSRDISIGQVVFNPQGNKFAYYEPYNDLDIWDFDRCSGDFSNQVHIDINDSAILGGAAFSPNGRYLYVSSNNYVYQFDVQASNIDSSKVIVGAYDGFTFQGLPTDFYLSELAPDNKIYINSGNSANALHVINSPDSMGLSCGFCQHCIALPGLNAFTIPNHPNYFLGADTTSLCDTITAVTNQFISPTESFTLFPNPVRDQLYINHSMKEPLEQIGILNSLGQYESVQFISINNGEYLQVDLSSFASGVYCVQMKTEKQVVTKKVMKQ